MPSQNIGGLIGTSRDEWEFRVQEESEIGKEYRAKPTRKGRRPRQRPKSRAAQRRASRQAARTKARHPKKLTPVERKEARLQVMAQPLSARGAYEEGTEIKVPSTAIFWVEYYPEQQILIIAFRVSGKYYTYFKVPEGKFKAFKIAPSKGRYFNKHIRNKYSFARGAIRP